MLIWLLPYSLGALLAALATSRAILHEHEHDYGKPLWNATYTDLLKRDLLATYDKFARPNHHSNVTKVYLDLDFRHVDLDDAKSLFTVNTWVQLTWKDEKLIWNASDYGGLNVLHLADHEIWEPDIVLYNSALGNNIDHYGNTHCVARPNGEVLWVPPSQFVVYCELDLSKWPFDRHTCTLRLGSWTYNGEQVDLQLKQWASKEVEPKVDVKVEWNIIKVTKQRHVTYYSCCPEPYVDLDFAVTVERRSAAYKALVIVPSICMVFLTLTSLWLPGRERYLMTSMTALISALFLLYFSFRLPVVGPTTPIIVIFYSTTFLMVTITVALTVILQSISQSQLRVPRMVVNTLRGPLSTFLLLPKAKSKTNYTQHGYDEEPASGGCEELREYEVEQEDSRILTRRGPQEGWTLVSVALDRLAFLAYVIVFASLGLRALL